MVEWVAVAVRAPDCAETVFFYSHEWESIHIGYCEHEIWYDELSCDEYGEPSLVPGVTHWMKMRWPTSIPGQ